MCIGKTENTLDHGLGLLSEGNLGRGGSERRDGKGGSDVCGLFDVEVGGLGREATGGRDEIDDAGWREAIGDVEGFVARLVPGERTWGG